MKKYIILIVLLVCGVTFGNAHNITRVTDADMKTAILRANMTLDDFGGGGLISSGNPYYVDTVNGASNRSGRSWDLAVNSIDTAVNLISAAQTAGTEKGDCIIYVREGSNQGISTDSAIDIDVSGTTVYCLGSGPNRMTIDYDANIATFVVGAPGVTLFNMLLRPSTNGVSSGIVIEAGANGTRIINCDFGPGEAETDEFEIGLNINASVSDTIVRNCRFRAATNAASAAIYFAVIDGLTVDRCELIGDYSSGCIFNVGAADNIIIRDSLLFNGGMEGDGDINAVAAINVANSTSGLVTRCDIISDVATALLMRVADDMVFMNNIVSDTDGDEFSGSPEAGVTFLGAAGGVTTKSTISGHVDG